MLILVLMLFVYACMLIIQSTTPASGLHVEVYVDRQVSAHSSYSFVKTHVSRSTCVFLHSSTHGAASRKSAQHRLSPISDAHSCGPRMRSTSASTMSSVACVKRGTSWYIAIGIHIKSRMVAKMCFVREAAADFLVGKLRYCI